MSITISRRCVLDLYYFAFVGITSIAQDMCPNSCIAYTGPYKSLESCPECSVSRWDVIKLKESKGKTKSPSQVFHTIPIGPVIQALHRSVEGSTALQYRVQKTLQAIADLNNPDPLNRVIDDVFCSQRYLDSYQNGRIKDADTVLMFQLDGAQLYAHKTSDTWILIWIILDLPPHLRYKKRFVIPAGVIPGPNKPKIMDSFLFVSMHHLAAIQNDGLAIWSPLKPQIYRSDLWLFIGGGDTPGVALLSGFVTHTGLKGCRRRCAVKGRHKAGTSCYYPVLLLPEDYDVEHCDHGDIDAELVTISSVQEYRDDLAYVSQARSANEFMVRFFIFHFFIVTNWINIETPQKGGNLKHLDLPRSF